MCAHSVWMCASGGTGGFVCPPQVLWGFRFKQSGESHYLSDALPMFTHVIPKRLRCSISLSFSLFLSLLSLRKERK